MQNLRFLAASILPRACLFAAVVVGIFAGVSPSWAKSKFNKVLSAGDAAPAWKDLPGVDDKSHSLADYKDAKVLVIVFTCNHCPVAKGYEKRVGEFVQKYADRGVQLVAISVSLNEADRLEKMKVRAREQKLSYPYLYDESQQSGKDYGATVTPHFFVLDADRKVAFMGAFDDSFEVDKVQKNYVVDAVEALLEGKPVKTKESLQRGCAIEYE